jgi:hypothetical protein
MPSPDDPPPEIAEQLKKYGALYQPSREEAMYDLMSMAPPVDPGRGFLSSRLQEQIRSACRHDERYASFWTYIANNVRQGLNDHIVDGIFRAFAPLMRLWDEQLAQRDTRNLDNIRGIVLAAREVIEAYDGAESRGEIEYMEAAIEELDAAIEELTLRSPLSELPRGE